MNKQKYKIMVVLGTRPEFIKMYSIIKEINSFNINCCLVHTGQHYDFDMSEIFFKELNLPKPKYFLNTKASTSSKQISKIIIGVEKVILKENPDLVLVQGDTNSALGGALSSNKSKKPVGHIEAGCRSFDEKMPEEINRKIIADIATLNFAPTEYAYKNLLSEGIEKTKVFLTGHPLIDLIDHIKNGLNNEDILDEYNLRKDKYYVFTLHRQNNIENKENLHSILSAINIISNDIKVIFPIHPHTKKCIEKYGFKHLLKNILVVHPLSYTNLLTLLMNSRMVLTDSGGIQQEAALLKTICVTLRENTEWVETVESKINYLVGSDEEKIINVIEKIETNKIKLMKNFNKDIYGSSGVSNNILNIILNYLDGLKNE